MHWTGAISSNGSLKNHAHMTLDRCDGQLVRDLAGKIERPFQDAHPRNAKGVSKSIYPSRNVPQQSSISRRLARSGLAWPVQRRLNAFKMPLVFSTPRRATWASLCHSAPRRKACPGHPYWHGSSLPALLSLYSMLNPLYGLYPNYRSNSL